MVMNVFNNKYLIMRHGESEANVAGLIVSDPAIGCERYGLTELGRQQVLRSVTDYMLANFPTEASVSHPISKVICSDFLRTIQTANQLSRILGLPAPQIEPGLRERFFGDWEGKPDTHYPEIWKLDNEPVSQTIQNIETAIHVRRRGLDVIEKLERQFDNEVILLVSHGDMLQILMTAFFEIPAEQHRSVPHHKQAEIKSLMVSEQEFSTRLQVL